MNTRLYKNPFLRLILPFFLWKSKNKGHPNQNNLKCFFISNIFKYTAYPYIIINMQWETL